VRRKPARPHHRSPIVLILIASLKLLKAFALFAIGFGAIHFLHRDLAASAIHWTQVLGLDPDNRHVHAILEKVLNVTPKQLRALSAGTFIYAALFSVEGVGLLMDKHWAEYLTIISTALLMPLELYELFHRFTFTRLVVLIVNGLIVWYLIKRVRK